MQFARCRCPVTAGGRVAVALPHPLSDWAAAFHAAFHTAGHAPGD